jgi:hypothetical protein
VQILKVLNTKKSEEITSENFGNINVSWLEEMAFKIMSICQKKIIQPPRSFSTFVESGRRNRKTNKRERQSLQNTERLVKLVLT